MSADLELRVADHLWTDHNWQLVAQPVGGVRHLQRHNAVAFHAFEHRVGAGMEWPGWREHPHAEDVEATVPERSSSPGEAERLPG